MKNILLGLMIIAMTLPVKAESLANGSLSFIINRYVAKKKQPVSENREIAYACAGTVYADFVNKYLEMIERKNLNIKLINSYERATFLLNAHYNDIEVVYRKARTNLIDVLSFTFSRKLKDSEIEAIPDMDVESFGEKQLAERLALCSDAEFITEVALQAPLTDSLDSMSEGISYRVPIMDNEPGYGGLVGSDNDEIPQGKKVKQTLEEWLYEIKMRQ